MTFPNTAECARKSDDDVVNEIGALLMQILQMALYSTDNPVPRTRWRLDSRGFSTHVAPGSRQTGEFQGGLKELQVRGRVAHVYKRGAARWNSQRLPHAAKAARLSMGSLRISTVQVRDSLGHLSSALRHFARGRGRGRKKGQLPLLARNRESINYPWARMQICKKRSSRERGGQRSGSDRAPRPSFEEIPRSGRGIPRLQAPDSENLRRGAISLMTSVNPHAGLSTPGSPYTSAPFRIPLRLPNPLEVTGRILLRDSLLYAQVGERAFAIFKADHAWLPVRKGLEKLAQKEKTVEHFAKGGNFSTNFPVSFGGHQ